jgi:16S rRNA C967 or C1407 C5-methylase (RsmB/RsmF family)
MNSNRQKRIVANAIGTIAPGGYLAYMTCTFSRAENEAVIEWVMKKFPYLHAIPVPGLSAYQSTQADFPCYRMFPQSGIGAGAFACLLQSEEKGQSGPIELSDIGPVWRFPPLQP